MFITCALCFGFQYENVYERDVRLVYEGQNAIHQMIRYGFNKIRMKTNLFHVRASATSFQFYMQLVGLKIKTKLRYFLAQKSGVFKFYSGTASITNRHLKYFSDLFSMYYFIFNIYIHICSQIKAPSQSEITGRNKFFKQFSQDLRVTFYIPSNLYTWNDGGSLYNENLAYYYWT